MLEIVCIEPKNLVTRQNNVKITFWVEQCAWICRYKEVICIKLEYQILNVVMINIGKIKKKF